jgi:hypothetical protein
LRPGRFFHAQTKEADYVGEVISIDKTIREASKYVRKAQSIINGARPEIKQAVATLIAHEIEQAAARLQDSQWKAEYVRQACQETNTRLLRDVLQVLQESFGWPEEQLGRFIHALNTRGQEVKNDEQHQHQHQAETDQPSPSPTA